LCSAVTEKQFANVNARTRSGFMRLPLTLLLLGLSSFGAHLLLANQGPVTTPQQGVDSADAKQHQQFSEIPAVVQAVYQSVSFEKGSEPNWALLRSTLFAGARFCQPPRRPLKRALRSADDFIDSFKEDMDRYNMRTSGFWERIVNTTTTQFGDTATVFVVFEVRLVKDSPKPQGRGLDTISLIRTEGRWWITSIVTEFERPNQLLPEELLK
jgi:hypothetical protein